MRSPSPHSFRRRLTIYVSFLLVVIWAISAFDLWRQHREREEDARQQVTQLSRAFCDHIRTLLHAADSTILGLSRDMQRLYQHGKLEDAATILSPEERWGDLYSYALFDAEGRSLSSSEPGFSKGRDFSECDYIKVHLNGQHSGLFVGQPVISRTFGKRFFPVSRAILAADGHLIGIIMASIDAQVMGRDLGHFGLGPRSGLAVLHTSGRVVARWPNFEKHFNQDVSSSVLFSQLLPQAPEGDYEVATATDGLTRLIHYKRIADFPLVVAFGFAREDVYDAQRVDVIVHLLLAVGGSLLILGGAWLLWGAQRRTAQAAQTLEISEQRYHGLYDSIRDGILLRDRDGRILDCNKAYCAMLGVEREQLLGRTTAEFTAPGRFDKVEQAANAQIEAQGYCEEFEKEYLLADGKHITVRIRGWMIRDSHGQPSHYWGLVRDVTDQKAAEEQLILARRIIESSSEAILVVGADGLIVAVNAAFEGVTGFQAAEVIGENPRIFSSGQHDQAFYQAMWASLIRAGRWDGEIYDRRKNGEVFPAWVRINNIRDPQDGRVTHYVAVFADISERKASEERIRYLAQHDQLTGLPNRNSLNEFLAATQRRCEADAAQFAVLFIDLDNFKTINDSLGHHVGDALLVDVAQRLRQALRQSDLVARLGGDEFVIVMQDIDRRQAAAGMADKVLRLLGEPYAIDGNNLRSSPSIGIAFYPENGNSSEELMRHADAAMYHAKANGKNNYQFFAEHMNETAGQRLVLENALRGALNEGQLFLNYQPQVDIVSGQVLGAEALLRWQHPQLGLISPADFIPVAEESGLIDIIGRWVLHTACSQGRRWLEQGWQDGLLAVNVSARQLRQADFVDLVATVLAETGFPAQRLELEITETAMMASADRSADTLHRLRGMGLHLALDDFGTGYSSLAYLHRFPVQRIKIDRSFISELPNEPAVIQLVKAIIALGKALNMELLAEGVESVEQADFLIANGCPLAQGYYYHRPLSVEHFSDLIGLPSALCQ